jgi:hypothetical protein
MPLRQSPTLGKPWREFPHLILACVSWEEVPSLFLEGFPSLCSPDLTSLPQLGWSLWRRRPLVLSRGTGPARLLWVGRVRGAGSVFTC